MKFRVKRGALLRVLEQSVIVAEKKTTIPILGFIKITVKEDEEQIIFNATDQDCWLERKIDGTIFEEGEICTPLVPLLNVVKAAGDEIDFKLNPKTNQLDFVSGSFKGRLGTGNVEDFPSLIEVKDDPLVISGELFRKGLDKTFPAMSKDSGKWNFNVVQLEIDKVGTAFRTVAADGKALICFDTNTSPDRHKIMIPAKAVRVLRDILPNSDVEVVDDGMSLAFNGEGFSFRSRRSSGTFPAYDFIFPQEKLDSITFGKEDILTIFQRAGIGSDAETKIVKCRLQDNALNIFSEQGDISTSDTIPVEQNGADFYVGMMWTYIIEAMGVLEKDEIVLSYSKNNGPWNFFEGNEKYSLRYFINPWNIVTKKEEVKEQSV